MGGSFMSSRVMGSEGEAVDAPLAPLPLALLPLPSPVKL